MTKLRYIPPMATVGLAILVYALCPKPSLYGSTPWSEAVFDVDGRLLRLERAADEQYRLQAPHGSLPPALADALMLYEDRHFRHHPGINPAAVARAAWTTWVARTRTVGASTLSMQLARMRYRLDTTTMAGKLRQMGLALAYERHYSKDAILNAWLDLAPFGGNVEGIEAAALVYFDKPAADLAIAEILALVVVPQNPTGRNPATASGKRAMLAARDRLATRWLERRPDAALAAQLELPLAVRSPASLPNPAPHFTRDFLVDRTRKQRHRVTLDTQAQELVSATVHRYVDHRRRDGIVNAAALLVDHRTMSVVAEVGSAGFLDSTIDGQVNGTRARRSPGSTLKPFVYGLALDAGLIHPMTLLADAPARYAAYTPENFDRGFAGPILARDALIFSRNVPAVSLLSRVGTSQLHGLLDVGGVTRLKSPEHYGLAIALGGAEVTMRELVALYGALANGGSYRPLRDTGDDTAVSDAKRLLSMEAAFLVLDMLAANARPTLPDYAHDRSAFPVAWKTGTSYARRDAWSVGVFGQYVLAVWVGNFDGSGNAAFVGREAAAPLFFRLVDTLTPSVDPSAGPRAEPPAHLNLRRVDMCAPTGDLPGPHCPATTRGWFIPGVSPIRVSDVHRAVLVDETSGLRACDRSAPGTRLIVYEFWPSDMQRVMREAGLAVRSPPLPGPGCTDGRLAAAGHPPRITSPDAALIYRLREGDAGVPLAAVTDADARALYWYVGDRFLGRIAAGEVMHWAGEAGHHTVTAVDDLGRAATGRLTVLPVAGVMTDALAFGPMDAPGSF